MRWILAAVRYAADLDWWCQILIVGVGGDGGCVGLWVAGYRLALHCGLGSGGACCGLRL